ncbi:MAG TPA: YkvA family protein [Xanthomonadaceae bacterium]|nr:YkvA family protein [Xanthomonadaceae bacterium]
MTARLSIQLDEATLVPFAQALERSGADAERMDRDAIRDGGLQRWAELDLAAQPQFVRARLSMVPRLLELFSHDDWRVPDAVYRDLLGALAYFVEADDLIPDDSRMGLLDDALVLQLALDRHAGEWRAWLDFRDLVELHPDSSTQGYSRERWLQDAEAAMGAVVSRPRTASFLDGARSGRFQRESHRYAASRPRQPFAVH